MLRTVDGNMSPSRGAHRLQGENRSTGAGRVRRCKRLWPSDWLSWVEADSSQEGFHRAEGMMSKASMWEGPSEDPRAQGLPIGMLGDSAETEGIEGEVRRNATVSYAVGAGGV